MAVRIDQQGVHQFAGRRPREMGGETFKQQLIQGMARCGNWPITPGGQQGARLRFARLSVA